MAKGQFFTRWEAITRDEQEESEDFEITASTTS